MEERINQLELEVETLKGILTIQQATSGRLCDI